MLSYRQQRNKVDRILMGFAVLTFAAVAAYVVWRRVRYMGGGVLWAMTLGYIGGD